MQRPTISILRAAILSIGLGMVANAGAVTIDEFTTNQGPLSVSPSGPTSDSSSATGADMIGGERDLQLSTTPGGSFSSSSAMVNGGALVLANSSQFSSVLTFQWDGADGDPNALDATGLGGMDLTSGGADAFEIRFIFDDLPATLEMNIYTNAGSVSTFTWPTAGAIFTDLSMFIPFATFTGSADFTNVGAIELIVSSPIEGLDLEFDYIRTTVAPVPGPAAILLFGSALGMLGMVRRRGDDDRNG